MQVMQVMKVVADIRLDAWSIARWSAIARARGVAGHLPDGLERGILAWNGWIEFLHGSLHQLAGGETRR